mgnify:CR=1 FL=1|jgi:nicotinamide mononucleotide transporter
MQDQTYEIIEWCAVLLNIGYVILAAHQRRFCWVIGGIASLISIFLFMHVRLYSEAVLYFVYVILAYYGWSSWNEKEEHTSEDIIDSIPSADSIIEWSWSSHIMLWILGSCLAWCIAYIFMLTDAARPVLDAFTTSFSLIATWLTVKKVLTNWVYWVIIDVISSFLYLSRGLEIYAVQMGIFAILAAWGFYTWLKEYKRSESIA